MESRAAAPARTFPAVILYLHGFASGPSSAKGVALEERFARAGVRLVRADLTPGERGFERSTPRTMLAEAERALDAAPGTRFVFGSSLGGWLAALLAERRAAIERVVLLAPAFRLHARWTARLTPGELARWRAEGAEVDHHATRTRRRIGWAFLEEAAALPPLPDVRVPALCFAGTRDDTVPLADVAAWVDLAPDRRRLVAVDDGHDLLASIDRIFEEARRFVGL
jgi:pimeloyl-ACP methyl ester carboxylesterase